MINGIKPLPSVSDFDSALDTLVEGIHLDFNKSKGMDWHIDTKLYNDIPQFEVVYNVKNTSDSKFQWKDEKGKIHF